MLLAQALTAEVRADVDHTIQIDVLIFYYKRKSNSDVSQTGQLSMIGCAKDFLSIFGNESGVL